MSEKCDYLYSYVTVGNYWVAHASSACMGYRVFGTGRGETREKAEAAARQQLSEERNAVLLGGWIPDRYR